MLWIFYTKYETDPTLVFYSARKDKDDYIGWMVKNKVDGEYSVEM